ncbi:MAG: four-carbon acid sugar kinase family protein [Rhodococcus sp. (in: high G+C Gram-positive bacteria)]
MSTLDDLLADHSAAPTVGAATVREGAGSSPVLVVLDDDPTGTQSVHDLPVLTRWDHEHFEWAFSRSVPAVYVLTNTRSLDPAEAEHRNQEIADVALSVAGRLGIEIAFVSRSDSTLRGHFPLETDTLMRRIAASGGSDIDGVILVPAFPDAGRVTVDGVHYFVDPNQGDRAVPVAETEFARDATFGFASSDLASWVQEKTAGRVAAEDVLHIDLRTIRTKGAEGVAEILGSASGAIPVVVDMVVEEDLREVALGIQLAQSRGQHFLYRVGPPFVRAMIGQEPREPLTAADVFGADGPAAGGLVVVGSHVGLTTRQLADLAASDIDQTSLVVDVPTVIDPARREAYLAELVDAVHSALADKTVVVSTSRTLVKTTDGAESLDISRQVSSALVHIVRSVLERGAPRFVIAKGGITSSDLAAHGLGMSRAIAKGPMLPGIVSLWEPKDGPGLGIPYVVFAGNVGGTTSLTDVVRTLSKENA